jgi:hypothetical protein
MTAQLSVADTTANCFDSTLPGWEPVICCTDGCWSRLANLSLDDVFSRGVVSSRSQERHRATSHHAGISAGMHTNRQDPLIVRGISQTLRTSRILDQHVGRFEAPSSISFLLSAYVHTCSAMRGCLWPAVLGSLLGVLADPSGQHARQLADDVLGRRAGARVDKPLAANFLRLAYARGVFL